MGYKVSSQSSSRTFFSSEFWLHFNSELILCNSVWAKPAEFNAIEHTCSQEPSLGIQPAPVRPATCASQLSKIHPFKRTVQFQRKKIHKPRYLTFIYLLVERGTVTIPKCIRRIDSAEPEQSCEDRNVKFLELIVAEVAGSSPRSFSRFPVPYFGSIGLIVGGLSGCRSLPS